MLLASHLSPETISAKPKKKKLSLKTEKKEAQGAGRRGGHKQEKGGF